MDKQYNIDESIYNSIDYKNGNDPVDVSMSMMSVISKHDDQLRKTEGKRSSISNIMTSQNKLKKSVLFKPTNLSKKDQENLTKIRGFIESKFPLKAEPENSKIQFNSITDVSIFKETIGNKVVYFYRITGDISHCKIDENEEGRYSHFNYKYIELPIDHFLSGKNTIFNSAEAKEIQDVETILLKYTKYFNDFFAIGDKIINAYNKVLKYVDLNSYLIFILNQKEEINLNDSDLQEKIQNITIENLKDNISNYINFLLHEFNDMVVPYKDCNNVYQVIDLLKLDIKVLKNDIEKHFYVSGFSIVKNLIEILSKIQSHLFLSMDKGTKNSSIVKEYYDLLSTDISIQNQKEIFKAEKILDNYQVLIMSIYYSFLLKVNLFYKENVPFCCGNQNSKDINYLKCPYVFCYTCKMLICKNCFYSHENHNYFDFACTIRNKIGNIRSDKTKYLNWKEDPDLNKMKERICEDNLLNVILRYVHFDIDDLIKQKIYGKENSKYFDLTAINLIDIFLFEFLFKEIYPIIENEDYFNYEMKMKSDIRRKDSLIQILYSFNNFNDDEKDSKKDKNIFELYVHYRNLETEDKETETALKILKQPKCPFGELCIDKIEKEVFKEFEQEKYIDEEIIAHNVSESYDEEEKKDNTDDCFFGKETLDKQNTGLNTIENLEQVIDSYQNTLAKIKFINKGDEVNEAEDLNHSTKQIDVSIKLDKEKKMERNLVEKEFNKQLTQKKYVIDDFVLDFTDKIATSLEENIQYETKWYYLEKDEEKKRSIVKYIDGMGPVYNYVSYYLENIFSNIAQYENFDYDLNTHEEDFVIISSEDY